MGDVVSGDAYRNAANNDDAQGQQSAVDARRFGRGARLGAPGFSHQAGRGAMQHSRDDALASNPGLRFA